MARHLSIAAIALGLAVALWGCAENEKATAGQARAGDAAKAAAPAHGAHEQGMLTPEDIVWKDGPPSLPKGSKIAVLEGDPTKAGYFAMRLKFPDGYKVPPHWHPGTERVTIIAGTLNLGMGETFDPAKTRALTAGSYSFMPPGMRHFAWAKGETELQLSTIGPWEINYLNPADDPRKAGK